MGVKFKNVRNMCLLLSLLILSGISGVAFPVRVLDDRGCIIVIPEEPARIVIAGVPLYAEILVDLGLASRIVGVSDSPNLPEELAKVPHIGPSFAPSLETILSLEPDLVLGAWGEVRERLEALGFIVLTGGGMGGWICGIPEVFSVILLVGQAVGLSEKAEALVGKLAKEIVALEAKVLDRPRKRAVFLFLLTPDSPPFAAGQGTPEHELLLRAGAENLFGEVPGYFQVSMEELFYRDPAVIFTDQTQVENFSRNFLFQDLLALKGKKIVGIPAAWILSTKLVAALAVMARTLHPEAFSR